MLTSRTLITAGLLFAPLSRADHLARRRAGFFLLVVFYSETGRSPPLDPQPKTYGRGFAVRGSPSAVRDRWTVRLDPCASISAPPSVGSDRKKTTTKCMVISQPTTDHGHQFPSGPLTIEASGPGEIRRDPRSANRRTAVSKQVQGPCFSQIFTRKMIWSLTRD